MMSNHRIVHDLMDAENNRFYKIGIEKGYKLGWMKKPLNKDFQISDKELGVATSATSAAARDP